MTKDEYLSCADAKFTGKAHELVKAQIELFFDEGIEITHRQYAVGDDVFLKKGTYLHGVFGELDGFDYVVENGFISVDFTDNSRVNKISHSVGMWDIQNDISLAEYVRLYSGFTITYTIGRGPGSTEVTELIPYHCFDKYTERINNDERIWMYWGDQTKEVRFLPSLVANKKQIAFILNMESDYARELIKADVWNTELDAETLKPFLDYRYYEKFLKERFNRTAQTTDRESAIIFGLPSRLIEGVFVGRRVEADAEKLKYIKSRLPDCYICNIDGKVIG